MDSHCIETEDLKENLLYEGDSNTVDNNENIKHFLLLVLQAVAMFVVSSFFLQIHIT